MKITIGSDHRGYDLKAAIIANFGHYQWLDVGTDSKERTDYPIFAKKVCENILDKTAEFGILICGTGIGMSVAANRFRGIYAALCWNEPIARLARSDDMANVLVIPSAFVSDELAFAIIKAWLYTEFKGGTYQKRLELIDEK